jgi:pimeloyl-ACP methyl ester carboxylesterase
MPQKSSAPVGATIPEVTHHHALVNGQGVHYVAAGDAGDPIVLIHGFPESWWAFHKLIPVLAVNHRVFAVDLPGFGDSGVVGEDFDSNAAAEVLHRVIVGLGVGPVHLAAQDISGGAVYRLATEHPELLRSLMAIEMGLAGFGLEAFGDITRGGSWHIGALAAPGIATLLFPGRERDLLGTWAFPSMIATPGAISEADIEEFTRVYSRAAGWNGAVGLYRSMLTEGSEFQDRARTPLDLPALAVGGFGGPFTATTLGHVVAGPVKAVELDGVGHYVALEAPDRLADVIMDFVAGIES